MYSLTSHEVWLNLVHSPPAILVIWQLLADKVVSAQVRYIQIAIGTQSHIKQATHTFRTELEQYITTPNPPKHYSHRLTTPNPPKHYPHRLTTPNPPKHYPYRLTTPNLILNTTPTDSLLPTLLNTTPNPPKHYPHRLTDLLLSGPFVQSSNNSKCRRP